MSALRQRPPLVAQVIADICHDCPAPCPWQRSPAAHAAACAACPAGRWGTYGDCPPEQLGDRLAAQIEARVLTPLEQSLRAAAPLLAAVRRCGGCTQAKHAAGSATPHPDPGTVI